jgi:hypothetical protein
MNRFLTPVLTLTLSLLATAHASAATASDFLGKWVVDTDATWAEAAKNPKLAEVPAAEQVEVKKKLEASFASVSYEATADTFTTTSPGAKGGPAKVTKEAYKVLSIDGDTLNIERMTDSGAKNSAIEVKGDRLYAKNLNNEGAKGVGSGVIVLMHPAAKPGAATEAAVAAPSGTAPAAK